MGSALAIRDDLPASGLRQLARVEDDGRVACRLLALANALDGMSRAAAARQAGMDRQTLRALRRLLAPSPSGIGSITC
jgi:hypothetical protein